MKDLTPSFFFYFPVTAYSLNGCLKSGVHYSQRRAARADCIVSGDSDLLSPGGFQGIRILTATDFLAHVEA